MLTISPKLFSLVFLNIFELLKADFRTMLTMNFYSYQLGLHQNVPAWQKLIQCNLKG